MNIENYLQSTELFKNFSHEQIVKIAKLIRAKSIKKGGLIFNDGQEANSLFFLFSGAVKIFKLSPDGKEQILRIVKPFETFAEVPIFEGSVFPASGSAIEKSEIGLLFRQDLLLLIQEDSEIAMKLLAILAKRLRHLTQLIESLTLKESMARFAVYLLRFSQQHGDIKSFKLAISKTELSKLLGTSRENLSRISMKLIEQGVILVDNKQMTLLDLSRLSEIAKG